MSVYLLDINVLIALTWPNHVHHIDAHKWFGAHRRKGWATCPITQAGFVRISSNPKIITDAVSPAQASNALEQLVEQPDHTFFKDVISFKEAKTILGNSIQGHRQVTDYYLLALAIHHKAVLATFDRAIESMAPANYRKHVCCIESQI